MKPRSVSKNAVARALLIFQCVGVFLLLNLQVYGEGEVTIAVASKAGVVITNANPTEIKTLDGMTYNSIHSLKATTGGLVVQFTPAGGGMGIAKIKYENLPADLQQRFGSDIEKATAYEAEQTKGQAMVAAKMWADYKEATDRIAIRLAKEEAEAKAEAERRRIEQEEEAARVRIAKQKAEEEARRKEEEAQRKEDMYWIGRKAAEDVAEEQRRAMDIWRETHPKQ